MSTDQPPREPRLDPRTEPVRPRSRPAETERLAGSLRTTRLVAVAAIVLALAGLGLAAWPLLGPSGASGGCEQAAWDVDPDAADLPPDWSLAASQFDLSRKTMSFVGPLPEDEFTAQAQVISTVTCFEQGAAEAVSRSRQASVDAGQEVVTREDLGEQAFSAVDVSGATFLQLRAGRLVVYLASSAETSANEVDTIASAFDRALGGDGGTIAPVTPLPSDLGLESIDPEEPLPEESQAAPDLVAMLPTQVGDLAMIRDSATGSMVLADDQGSRAVLAILREAGVEVDDLKLAQAFDEMAVSDLSFLAVTVDGMPVEQTKDMVLDVWLSATGPGVTQSPVTLAGREFTRIDYGDDLTFDYWIIDGDAILVITTGDEALAETAAAALP